MARITNTTHGKYLTPEYRIWIGVISRCENPNAANYFRYGGKGISMTHEWRSDFEAFLRDVGERPSPKHSLDRIDYKGNYAPGNVRWATSTEQNCNRADNYRVLYRETEMSLSEAMRLSGAKVSRSQVRRRLEAGWICDRALDTPSSRNRDNGL